MTDIAYRILRAQHLQEYAEFLTKVDPYNNGQVREVIQSMGFYGVDQAGMAKRLNVSLGTLARWVRTGYLPRPLGREIMLQRIREQVLASVTELVNQD